MKLLEKLSESVEKSESFRQIMNDGIVEESEIEAQGKLVESLIEKLENQLSESDFKLVSDLISELSVFQLISNYR
jgi:UTP-glucose-1-phosphate uridylyltransferase